MENTEIVKVSTGIIHNVDDLSRIGKMMAVSGYFTDARDAAQAGVKIMAGMEMGFGAFASMTGIYIIQGKPSVGANLMASAVKNNPKYDYRVRKNEDTECRIEFFERVDGKWESIGVSSFTASEAKKAGVKNMDKFPRNMLFARAMSNGIRWYCPDVFAGNPTYTPEELGAQVDDEGNVTKLPTETVQNTPEAQKIVEAEATPINNTVAEEKPAEPQEKPVFDDVAFLQEWTRKKTIPGTDVELPATNLVSASETTTSKGKLFAKCSTEEFSYMWNAYQRRYKNTANAPEVREDALLKLSAINEILSAKANAQREMDALPDPALA